MLLWSKWGDREAVFLGWRARGPPVRSRGTGTEGPAWGWPGCLHRFRLRSCPVITWGGSAPSLLGLFQPHEVFQGRPCPLGLEVPSAMCWPREHFCAPWAPTRVSCFWRGFTFSWMLTHRIGPWICSYRTLVLPCLFCSCLMLCWVVTRSVSPGEEGVPFYSSSASNNRRCRRCRALLLPGIASEACHQCQGPGSSLRDADLISVWSQHLLACFWFPSRWWRVPDREHPSVPVLLDQRYLKKLSFKRLLAPASHMSIPCAEPAFMPPLGGHSHFCWMVSLC